MVVEYEVLESRKELINTSTCLDIKIDLSTIQSSSGGG